MSTFKHILRTTLIAFTLVGAAAGTSSLLQPTAITFADSSSQHDDIDVG
ncbi:hypothetical protein BH23DEI1_BH23DEI1_06420 [soil metagenome]|nr:hypothetical protein [Trueperaceae bacterium]